MSVAVRCCCNFATSASLYTWQYFKVTFCLQFRLHCIKCMPFSLFLSLYFPCTLVHHLATRCTQCKLWRRVSSTAFGESRLHKVRMIKKSRDREKKIERAKWRTWMHFPVQCARLAMDNLLLKVTSWTHLLSPWQTESGRLFGLRLRVNPDNEGIRERERGEKSVFSASLTSASV